MDLRDVKHVEEFLAIVLLGEAVEAGLFNIVTVFNASIPEFWYRLLYVQVLEYLPRDGGGALRRK